jgi:hypothetical protein
MAAVAKRMGIDAPALSRLETGKMPDPNAGQPAQMGRRAEAEVGGGASGGVSCANCVWNV